MEAQAIILPLAILTSLFLSGAHAATFTITNNCPFTVWPGILTGGGKPQVTTTGFELASKASNTIDIAASWDGRFWGRTGCTTDSTGKFSCATGDCASGQLTCNGAGGISSTLAEVKIAENQGTDFYDVSLVDGFNVPVAIAPQGGNKPNVGGPCDSTTCAADVNAACPPDLAVKGADGAVVACKSACAAFNLPQYCCTGQFNSAETCKPTDYSMYFKGKCPQAYSYAYDDRSSTFTCVGANYAITFCP